MTMGSKIGRGVDVAEVRARFEQWRGNREGKARIPDGLWADAIEVARREGVNRTAQELHLDGGKLKRLMVATDSGASEVPRQPRFVELIPPACAQPDEYVIEFEGSGGSKMRIQWKSTAPPDWASLLRAWRATER
jgi:hypothetical protein